MKGALALFRFLLDASARGERTALVTLTDVIGSSSRAAGTHMAVSASGAFHGSLSGGCVEAAVVAESQRVIAAGRAEQVRFGHGSPFIDVRLPCGGGIDLLITPLGDGDGDGEAIAGARAALEERRPAALALGVDGGLALLPDPEKRSTGWGGGRFVARHDPDLRLIVIGHGSETRALAALAQVHGAQVVVLSPERDIVEEAERRGLEAHWLKTPARSPHLATDRYSAVVTLFHDHDWETELLAQALEGDAFFIGAMGSRATHRQRLANLRRIGAQPAALGRLVGPIGIIPATRDPETLALSTLAQIAEHYRQALDAVADSAPGKIAASR